MRLNRCDQIRVGVATALLHPRYGGPAYGLQQRMAALNGLVDYRVFGVATRAEENDVKSDLPGVRVFYPSWPRKWFYAKRLYRAMLEEAADCEVFHAHMLWDYPVWAAHKVADSLKRPLLVTPHGSLMTRWRRTGLRKSLYKRTFLRAILSGQTALHVLNAAERDACREFGISNPIEIIPNGVPRALYNTPADPEIARSTWPLLRNRRVMLFMGRVWREKGLDILIPAWQHARATTGGADWILVIAGPDYRNYVQELETEVRALHLEESVFYIGPVESPFKESLLAASECFVLPSRSEGMSMAILEAMASGLPVAYSPQCNFPELAESGGGWQVAANVESFAEFLRVTFQTAQAELIRVGEKGRELGLREYTLEQSLVTLVKLYRRLASGQIPATSSPIRTPPSLILAPRM